MSETEKLWEEINALEHRYLKHFNEHFPQRIHQMFFHPVEAPPTKAGVNRYCRIIERAIKTNTRQPDIPDDLWANMQFIKK